ncbi:hypothetical protein MMJJ_02590 [Methanococcus maripaludis]|uniref:Uncharacterized protein n=1 Tax=Methanococcus maripaludis TaxID=39152 RepID=A0A2L1C8K8_METMI|nr:hypothetical protein MMJJ_02590 [Methanococcus maripaludis]MBB6497019.1 hypothetical protein [Methanococcus maripaludis]
MFFENGLKNSVIPVLKNIKHINYHKCVKMVLITSNSLNNILILKKAIYFLLPIYLNVMLTIYYSTSLEGIFDEGQF